MSQSNVKSPQSSQRTQSTATTVFANFAFFAVKSRCVTLTGQKTLTLIKNEKALVNIDLKFAIVLVIAAVMTAILIMPTLSHEDRSWRIKQYMTATRASDNLVQDTGSPPAWEANWSTGNYSDVMKIGFVYVDADGKAVQKVLNLTRIKALMGEGYPDIGTNITWWEYPNSTTTPSERENATRVLGLTGYNFYMQLHPVGLSNFDPAPLETNLTNCSRVPINSDTVTVVDRYVYIVNPDIADKIKYLKFDNEAIHYRLNMWVW